MIDFNKLKTTKDDDLINTFPGYTRSVLRRLKNGHKSNAPKILIFDIETAPMEVYTWGIFDQNIAINQIKGDWFILCYSAKWLFGEKILHDRLTGKESLKKNDRRIVMSLWKLLDEADMVVAHNGDAFDIKKSNARFLRHGLPLPSPYRPIDTLKIARQNFKITSNKLDYLCRFLGLKTKVDTGGFDLWRKCINGCESALKTMDTYCQNDVRILEELYLKLRPYHKSHPDVGLYMETTNKTCPNCGSEKLKWKGFYTTMSNKYKTARCECGAIIRSKEKYDTRRKK